MPEFQNAQYTRDVPSLPGQEVSANAGNVMPRFFQIWRTNSKGENVPVELVEIMIPGDNKNSPVAKVTDRHRAMWPQHYEAFKRQEAFIEDGTPIDAWGGVDANTARQLRAMNIMTVEQLAGVGDHHITALMGGRVMRDKARQYVALQKDNAETNRMVAENQALKDKIEMLERQVSEVATIAQNLKDQQQGQPVALIPDPPAPAAPGAAEQQTSDPVASTFAEPEPAPPAEASTKRRNRRLPRERNTG